MSGPASAEHAAMCLNVPFDADGKKRKSMTAVEHIVHNLDSAEELLLDEELLKRRRLIDNSGLCL